MAVWAERDSTQRRADIDLFHLLSFDYIEEEDFSVEPGRAQEQVVDRRECDTGAYVGVSVELVPQRSHWFLGCTRHIVALGHYVLQIPDTDLARLVRGREHMPLYEAEPSHGDCRSD